MFVVDVRKSAISLREKETIASGSVAVYKVKFNLDEAWKPEYKLFAVFKASNYTATVPLNEKHIAEIPWELTVKRYKGNALYAGVNGRLEDGTVVLPTIWVSLGLIQEGAEISDTVPRPPHKSAYDELISGLDGKGDSLNYEGDNLKLLSKGKEISSVTIKSGGDFEYATDEEIQSLFSDD